jgi:hypothetical protein
LITGADRQVQGDSADTLACNSVAFNAVVTLAGIAQDLLRPGEQSLSVLDCVRLQDVFEGAF